MKVAAVSWKMAPTDSVDEFFGHCDRLLEQCGGAELVVMPELTSLELLGFRPTVDPSAMPGFLADLLAPHMSRFGKLASSYKCTFVAGTHFVRAGDRILNAAVVAWADGTYTYDVPKVALTRFEKEDWGIQPGDGLRALPDNVGVTVCYDSEFPESGRALAESGVLLQCVPAFTETRYGFQRVRWCCQARATENQLIVIHASLLGDLGGEPAPSTFGDSAILAPSIEPFPMTAELARTVLGQEEVAIAEVDLRLIEAARSQGDVRNWDDRRISDWRLKAPIFPG